jgi:DNA-binding NtrC family response regulator
MNTVSTDIILKLLARSRPPELQDSQLEKGRRHSEMHQSALQGLKVLLVEDQPIIAMDVEETLLEAGVAVIESAATAAEALLKIETFTPDVAVLDVNLGSGTSLPVAQELLRRNIPFIFSTGYSDTMMLPPAMIDIPVLPKPFKSGALTEAVARAIRK